MGDTPHKPLLKLRTFQRDQAALRGEVPAATPESAPRSDPSLTSAVAKIVVPAAAEPAPPAPAATEKVISHPAPPSFHELKKHSFKKSEHIVAEEAPVAPKVVTVREKATPETPAPSRYATSSVITATKRSEFKFFPALLAALTNWWHGLFTQPKARPTYSIQPVENRKAVITKATTKSGATFTTDNATLKDELQKQRTDPKAEPVPHLTWTPGTEPGFALLEEAPRPLALPSVRPTLVTYKKKSLPTPELVVPTNAEPVVPQKRVFVPPPEPAKTAWESDIQSVVTPIPATPPAPVLAPIPQTPPAPVFKVPEKTIPVAEPVTPPPEPAPVLPPTAPTRFTKPGTSIPTKPNPKTSYLRRGLKELFRFDTTVTTVIVVGSFVSLVMVFLIIKTLFEIIAPTTTTTTRPLEISDPLTPAGRVIDLAVSSVSKEAIIAARNATQKPATGVVEFRIIEASGDALTGSRLFTTLGFSSQPGLSRSISQAHIGYADGADILVLEVSDAVTVLGALLAWETAMAQEFSTLFGTISAPISSVTDLTIQESDVRVLSYDGEVVLVYGFIDKNIVVITESVEAYEATLGSN